MKKLQITAACDHSPRFHPLSLSPALCVSIISVLMLLGAPAKAGAQSNVKNVLVLFSFAERSLTAPLDSLESSLRARGPWQINFYVEYLESRRFGDRGYERLLVENLRDTYLRQKLDLVIVESYPALQFALGHREELFPGVPIVFYGIDARRVAGQTWPGVTGVTETVDVHATIDLALHLHPKTNTVAITTGGSEYEKFWLAAVHDDLLRYHRAIKEVDLVSLPTYDLMQRVTALPQQAVVLFQRGPFDSVRPAFGEYDVLAWIGERRPTYCIFPQLCLAHGGIGGVETGVSGEISLMTEVAGRVLSGEQPEKIPVVHDPDRRLRVDWRQLQRWHIPESVLPSGTEVMYRPPSLWESYRKYVVAAIAVIAALLLLIIGLLLERTRKRKAEALLRESEKRFRVMADTTQSLVWMCDSKGRITYLNDRRIAFTEPDREAGYGDTWMEYVHPDDRRNVQDVISQALEDQRPFSNEYRLRRSDGAYRWMFDVASPRLNGDGSFAGFIGSAIDVTDQKLAQDALEQVSGRLIEAQEKERQRIARDLHDDICQRLALLSMELDQANRTANESADTTKQRLREIRQHCAEIAGDVQSLSHELHSSRLDYLGIVAAIRGFCHEFSKQHEVGIQFTVEDVPADLSREISLCLFRVTQEALHNAVKYSGVSQYVVELAAMADEIRLVVSDSGAGFDVDAAKKNRGLGLVSMQERAHLVQGMFAVESRPGQGTKILVVVPLASKANKPLEDNALEEQDGVIGQCER
jgi:PAS domain S-box-containing protein